MAKDWKRNYDPERVSRKVLDHALRRLQVQIVRNDERHTRRYSDLKGRLNAVEALLPLRGGAGEED